MYHRSVLSLSVALAIGITGASALAEEGVLEEVLVEEVQRGDDLSEVSALKTPTPLVDVPQSISVVGAEQIEEQQFTSIGDILRYVPGVSITQGEGHRDAIIIRGNESTADFFLDGVRDDVQYYRPLYNIERIEILRGSNALLFGRGGGGGVINRVAKKPEQANFYDLAASVDTFGAYNFAFDGNRAVNERAAVRLNAFYEHLDNHRDFFDGERFAFNPTADITLDAATNLFLSYEYLNDDRVVDRGVPSVSVAAGPDRPLSGFDNMFFGSPFANFATLEAHIFRTRLDHAFSDQWNANVTLQYANYDKLYQNLYPVGLDTAANQVTLDGYRDPTQRDNLIVQGNLVGEFATAGIGHTLLFGVEYGNQDTENSRQESNFGVNGVAGNLSRVVVPFTNPLAIPGFAFSDLVRDRESEVSFASVYLQDQIVLTDWLQLVGGFRIDNFDIDVTDRIEVADGAADGNSGYLSSQSTELSKRFGVILKPAEQTSFYVSYSETFLPRSGDQFLTLDLTSAALEPEKFENIEVGAKWDISSSLALTGALFRLEKQGVITADPANPGDSLILDGTVTRGAELQVVGAVTDRWTVSGGFSWLDAEVDGGDDDGNRLGQVPEYMVSLWNRYDITPKLGVGLGVSHQSKMFALQDNQVELPAYTRVDAGVFYALTPSLDLQLNIENLLDTDYFPDAHNNDNISTGEPVNARFTVRARF